MSPVRVAVVQAGSVLFDTAATLDRLAALTADAAELYDLKADPLGVKNLAADPAHDARVKELAELLDKLIKDHDALSDKIPVDEGIKNVLPKF